MAVPKDRGLRRSWFQNLDNLNLGSPRVEQVRRTPQVVVGERHISTPDSVPRTAGEPRKRPTQTLAMPARHEPRTNFFDVCRACLSARSVVNMCNSKYQGVSYVEIYETLTSIKVKPTDRISQNLCETCLATMNRFHIFRANCIRSEVTLTSMMLAAENRIKHEPMELEDHKSPQIDYGHDYEVACHSKASNSTQPSGRENLEMVRNTPQTHDITASLPQVNGSIDHTQGVDYEFNPVQTSAADSLQKHLNEMIAFLTEDHRQNMDVDRILLQDIPDLDSEKKQGAKNVRVSSPTVCALTAPGGSTRGRHVCDVGKRSFRNSGSYARHKKVHCERKHVCTQCGQGFAFDCDLKSHVTERHAGKKRFKCAHCPKTFNSESDLGAHNTIYRSDICRIMFRDVGVVRKHNIKMKHPQRT